MKIYLVPIIETEKYKKKKKITFMTKKKRKKS